MYSQFQSRYPTGSLETQLLQIHEGNYVVRAVIRVGDTTLATGMAAAVTIEQAEDQARARALVVLGIYLPTYESQAHLVGTDDQQPNQHSPARLNPAASTPDSEEISQQRFSGYSEESWELPETSQPDPVTSPGESMADLDLLPHAYADSHPSPETSELERQINRTEKQSAPQTVEQPNSNGKPLPQRSQSGSANDSLPGPIDLSDIITQTSVELKRLGWSDTRGRSYLQRTYGKRSRQQLTDEELLDFLHYLQAQPSNHEPSF